MSSAPRAMWLLSGLLFLSSATAAPPAVEAQLVGVVATVRQLMDRRHEAAIDMELLRAGYVCNKDAIAYARCAMPEPATEGSLSLDLHEVYDELANRRWARLIINVEHSDCARLTATLRPLARGLRPLAPASELSSPGAKPPPRLVHEWHFESTGGRDEGRYQLSVTWRLRAPDAVDCRMVVVLQSLP